MTEQEKREWLEWEANTDFNFRQPQYTDTDFPTKNALIVASKSSPKVEEYIANHYGTWVHKGGIWCFTLPNHQLWAVLDAYDIHNQCPRRIVIDSDIDYDILWKMLMNNCALCHKLEIT